MKTILPIIVAVMYGDYQLIEALGITMGTAINHYLLLLSCMGFLADKMNVHQRIMRLLQHCIH